LWPFPEVERLRHQINDLFDDDVAFGSTGLFDRSLSPRVDVVDTTEALLVACDLPGIDADDIELEVVNNVLTIRGEKKPHDQDGSENAEYRNEIWHGTFHRTLALPDSVNPDEVSAELKNGVLSIHIAKREERKPKRIGVKVK
jgi:HSP20 family protein